MSKLSSFLVGAAVALTSIALAHADPAVTGSWKLSVGLNAPCQVTLAPNPGSDTAGSASAAGDCNGMAFQQWKLTGSKLQLQQNNGTLVAYLKPKGNAFEGARVSDGKTVALTH